MQEINYNSVIKEFKTQCEKTNGIFGILGNKNSQEIPYGIIGKNGKKIAFIAGLHGNEQSGTIACSVLPEQIQIYNCRSIIVPSLNPYGFSNNKRTDEKNKDPNREYCNLTSNISKKIVDLITKNKCELLVTLHEDESQNEFYLYKSKGIKESLTNSIIRHANYMFKIADDKKIHKDKVENGIIKNTEKNKRKKHKCSLENYLYNRHNIEYITLEPPGKENKVNYFLECCKIICSKSQ